MMIKIKKIKKEDYWVSLSDMMTGLMVIFLFIAISYIQRTNQNIKVISDIQSKVDSLVTSYEDTRLKMKLKLDSIFKNDFSKWNANLDSNLVFRFSNDSLLFEVGQSITKTQFSKILSEFFPKYFDVLLNFRDKIEEIRIEGHTDSDGSYLQNLELSQNRARNVMIRLRENTYYRNLPESQKELLNFWINATGYSYSRTFDDNENFTKDTRKPENKAKSRRVEFRIITKSEKILKAIQDLNR